MLKINSHIFIPYLISMSIILSTGCFNPSKQNSNIRKTYYKTGELKSEQEYFMDSIKNGSYKAYYRNGNIKQEVNYVNGKVEGIEKSFYENGNIEYEINYSNNYAIGKGKWYYESGGLEAIAYFNDGKKVGEGYVYFPNGALKQYNFYNKQGELEYIRKYDNNMINIGDEGHAISNVLINSDTLQIGDTISVSFTIAQPPYTSFHFFVGDLDNDKIVINDRELLIDTTNNSVNYTKVYTRPGLYQWGAKLQLSSKTKDHIINYQFVMDSLVVLKKSE